MFVVAKISNGSPVKVCVRLYLTPTTKTGTTGTSLSPGTGF